MRVLVASTLVRPGEGGGGGKENYLEELSQGLLARDHEVNFLARFSRWEDYARDRLRFDRGAKFLSSTGASRILLFALGPLVVRPRGQRLASELAARVWATRLVAPVSWADVVHFDGTGIDLVGFSLLLAAERLGRPVVVVPHLHLGAWGDGALDRRLYRGAAAVVAKTSVEAQALVEWGVERRRIHVIGNAPVLRGRPDPEGFRRRVGIAGPLVLFLARKSREKGVDLLLAAVERVRAELPDVAFVVAGQGELDPSTRGKGVLELGRLDEDEKASALAACNVLCVPSRGEAFGMIYLEAWSFGKPVVAVRTPQVAAVVDDGVDGILVVPEPEEVARSILRLLRDQASANEMGERGRNKVNARFSWARIVQETIGVYESVVREFSR